MPAKQAPRKRKRTPRGAGTTFRLLAESSDNPEWSPNGAKLAFDSNRSSAGTFVGKGIYVADRDGRHPRRMAPKLTGSPASNPTWSPDGKLIAFFAGGSIYRMLAGGGGIKKLTQGHIAAQRPLKWSPNGWRIAFVCLHGAQTHNGPRPERICVIDDDGTNLVELRGQTNDGSEPTPSWSPDGRWVTYSGCPGATNGYRRSFLMCRIYVADVAGHTAWIIGRHGVSNADPTWRTTR